MDLRSPNNKENLRVLKQLIPERLENQLPSSGCETWKCAFSSDSSCFAWSSGYRLVTVLPCKQIIDKPCPETDLKPISIDCGDLVRSLTFASIRDLNQSNSFWHRIAQFKQLFLVTGHVTGRIRVWDLVAGKVLLELVDHKDIVCDLSVAPLTNDRLVSASFDGTIKVWNLMGDGNLVETFQIDGKAINALAWSPDSRNLAICSIGKVAYVWDMDTYKQRLALVGHQNNVVTCDFSPDGLLIATASWDTSLIIWNAQTGDKLREFFHLKPPPRLIYASGDNGNYIRFVAFAPDGAHITTVADDGFIRTWDLNDTDEPEANCQIGESLCCSYSFCGRFLAIGTRAGTVSILEPKTCVKSLLFLCRRTINKRQAAFGDIRKLDIPHTLIDYMLYKGWTFEK